MPYASPDQPIGTPFVELQTVDSTNNYALALIRASELPDRQLDASHGMAIFTHEQVAGKGQRGKTWASERDNNIALSLLVKPVQLGVLQQFHLSAVAAVSVCIFFEKYAGDETKIKWPNDLYWKDRKAGGILIESLIRHQENADARWDWAVVGIGININQTSFPADLLNPVSLKQISGQHHDPVNLAKELCRTFDLYYNKLLTDGFDEILSIYLSRLFKKDENVKLKKGNRIFEAVIKGVSRGGKLIVLHGTEEQFDHGEIQWII